jgi:hypothetical protein
MNSPHNSMSSPSRGPAGIDRYRPPMDRPPQVLAAAILATASMLPDPSVSAISLWIDRFERSPTCRITPERGERASFTDPRKPVLCELDPIPRVDPARCDSTRLGRSDPVRPDRHPGELLVRRPTPALARNALSPWVTTRGKIEVAIDHFIAKRAADVLLTQG